MNEEMEPTKEQKAQQAGRDVADTVARAAATYYGGAVGNKLYNAASNTQFVQNRLNTVGDKLSKNPILKNQQVQNAISNNKQLLDQTANTMANSNNQTDTISNNTNSETANKSGFGLDSLFKSSNNEKSTETNGLNTKKIKLLLKIIPPVALFLMIVLIIVMAISLTMSGFEYINSAVTTTGDKFWNFLSGCGWSTNEECIAKEQNNFYKEIEKQYNDYKNNYGVEIDKNLLVATLTYNNPFITATTTDELGSNAIDFKKGKNHVKKLIAEMVKEESACYIIRNDANSREEINCNSYEYYRDNKKDLGIKKVYKDTKYILTLEEYRNYLEDDFVIKYYLENKKTTENQQKALKITEEIYQRVELYEYLSKTNVSEKSFASNNTMITVTDCFGIAVEQMTLFEYLQGVLYMYYDESEEYLKYVAMAAKNYLYSINNASIENMPQTLRVQNCPDGQMSCNVTKGCHYVSLNGKNENLESGPDKTNTYHKLPISDVTILANIKKAIDDTIAEFIVKDNKIVFPNDWYVNKANILNQLKNTNYKSALINNFGGNIDSINLFAVGYPLDLKWNHVTSGYGWRIHPIQKICKYHNGTDIAANANSNIYSIADGVVTQSVTNYGLEGYGNYVEIGHGEKIGDYYEYYSLYAHQVKKPPVKVGQAVQSGEVIGYVGSTGRSTGNHLHIEVYKYVNGEKVSQDAVLTFKNVQLTGVTGPMYTSENQCNRYR